MAAPSVRRRQLEPQPSALSLDLANSCSLLLADSTAAQCLSSDARAALEQWASGQGSSTRKAFQLLQVLSDLLLIGGLTIPIASHFRPLLVDLTARLIPSSAEVSWQDQRCLATLHCFAALLAPFPEIYSVVSCFLSLPASEGGSLGECLRSLTSPDADYVLLSFARLCLASRPLAHKLQKHISANDLHTIYLNPSNWNATTRLLAIKVQALLTGLPEMSRKKLEDDLVGRPPLLPSGLSTIETADRNVNTLNVDPQDFEVVSPDRDPTIPPTDVWILPLAEKRRLHQIREYARDSRLSRTFREGPPATISSSDLSLMVRCVAGVLVFNPTLARVENASYLSPSGFIMTPTQTPTLNLVTQALVRRLPILLSGPASSGKSSLLQHLSYDLHMENSCEGSHIVTLQLGDHSSLDAKSLIGTYTSSSRAAGSFEWVEGALTRAVRQGKWVVLEDIDKASGEILSVMKPLVEACGSSKRLGALPELDLGARGKVAAGAGFALFATRSVNPIRTRDGSTALPLPTFLGNSHWTEIICPGPSEDDITMILRETFPSLCRGSRDVDVLDRLISAWKSLQISSLSGQAQQIPPSSRRSPNLRDLKKWCRRIDAFLTDASTANQSILDNQRHLERVFMEAAEIFLGGLHVSTSANVDAFFKSSLESLGLALGLSPDRAWWLLCGRTPELTFKGNVDALDSSSPIAKLKIGRVELIRQTKSDIITSSAAVPTSRSFAMTRPAAILLERIAASVALTEPILLVGETGTGKTTSVQHLASLLGQPMIALNLSQQTEASDLLGSYKPLEPRAPAMEIHNMWYDLFEQTFSAKRNARFVELERKALQNGKWVRLATLWKESIRMANERHDRKLRLLETAGDSPDESPAEGKGARVRSIKKRKTERGQTPISSQSDGEREAERSLHERWQSLSGLISDFAVQHASGKRNFVFSFIEGPLVKAIRDGSWVLLDEINLAAAETLDSLASLLQSTVSSITLFEKGDIEPIQRHPNFRIFACMNPATDVGKKDLPANLRSRFTELYVQSPDSDREALVAIVEKYIGHLTAGDRSALLDVAECYAEIRRLACEHLLADGANQRPHFSIRTLSRALTFASDQAATYGLRRALWEGFTMAFTMLLDEKSARTVQELLHRQIISRARNANAASTFIPARPKEKAGLGNSFVQVGPFWLQNGPEPIDPANDYILTPSVQAKLVGLARAILARKSPVLIQGPTSAGKTSAVEYLARRTGHRFVRISNHEHTDVQEYLGSYASDPDSGQLVFHEGLLVQALRRGDWIVLDELNLAPTDVLEALNRLLDDNRELVIPETGEVVKPHPSFMLFATQNPPGIYAGRKVLSRAFRNRFLEVHFDDVPRAELEKILSERCKIPPSYAGKIVAVFVELQKRRQAGRVFDSNQAFVTLRDLFRWGQREAQNYHQLAEDGYMLIAERARRSDDKLVVKEVIEEVMRVRIEEENLYCITDAACRDSDTSRMGSLPFLQGLINASQASGIVWTKAMQRLLCLVATCLMYNEPVLLVGETGSGKTSVCGVLAHALGRHLHTVNCHQSTDTADLLGGQRPIRNRTSRLAKARAEAERVLKELGQMEILGSSEIVDLDTISSVLSASISSLPDGDASKVQGQAALQQINQATALFEWRDGPLVEAMKAGDHLLLDEISLADDSVLERLNSVLEPGRTLVLAERSGASPKSSEGFDAVQLRAKEGFQVIATMNPGGDYGKKELSPALRNRFTEIWVPQVEDRGDILQILETQWKDEALRSWGAKILVFVEWFAEQIGVGSSGGDRAGIGLRDYIAWVAFMNATATGPSAVLSGNDSFAHGGLLTFVEGIGASAATSTMTSVGMRDLRAKCFYKLQELCGDQSCLSVTGEGHITETRTTDLFGLGPFVIKRGPSGTNDGSHDFSFRARTTSSNAVKVLRALYVPGKSILLEGSPGAGKTSLIGALANASGNHLTRINLSDQTELIDLFGADLPVEGGSPGQFAWKDAAFLKAMENGEWVLLDEMNLASQSVLEGLNSCLDHRGSVYIPELGRSFKKHPDFRLFAAQNPQQQGGGRKGLPKSFLNRFTKVHIDELKAEDILTICSHLYPAFPSSDLERMIVFNSRLHEEVMVKHSFGRQGSPWEFNLRDLLRWLALTHSNLGLNWAHRPVDHLAELYIQRFRSHADRRAAAALYSGIFGSDFDPDQSPWPLLTPHHVQFGHVVLTREPMSASPSQQQFVLLQQHLPALESLADCVRLQWLSIVVGPDGCGKTSLIRMLASLAGRRLEELRMNSGIDTMDVLGTFEQMDAHRSLRNLLEATKKSLSAVHLPVLQTSSSEVLSSWSAANHIVVNELDRLAQPEDANASMSTSVAILADHLETLSNLASMDHFCDLVVSLRREASIPQSSRAAGRFEWKDGPLLRAMQEGSWILLDDANLCSASVLDRLNSLFEPGGSLIISERGVVDGEIKVIKPHPDFRLFMALDPQHGELSRAMRNRGLELYLTGRGGRPESVARDAQRLFSLDSFGYSSLLITDASLRDLEETELSRVEHAIQLLQGEMYSEEGVERFLTTYLPQSLVSLASRAALPAHRARLYRAATILQDETAEKLVRSSLEAWQTQHHLDPHFLLQQPSDVGHNPCLWDNGVKATNLARSALSLLFDAAAMEQSLLVIASEAEQVPQQKGGSILQRSARYAAQRVDREGTDEDQSFRLVYPFLLAFAASLRSFISSTTDLEALISYEAISDLVRSLQKVAARPQFDFSAIQIIMTDVQAQLSRILGTSKEILDLTSALCHRVALTSGFAMKEIWELSMPPVAFVGALSYSRELVRLLSVIEPRSSNKQLIATAVDLSATLRLSQRVWTDAERTNAEILARDVIARLQAVSKTSVVTRNAVKKTSWELPSLAALGLQIRGLKDSNLLPIVSAGSAKEVIESTSYPLTAAVVIRELGWRAARDEIEGSGPASTMHGLFDWVKPLTESGTGCEGLFRPFLLRGALFPSTSSRISMSDLLIHRHECARLARLSSLLRPATAPSRCRSLQEEISTFIDILFRALAPFEARTAAEDRTQSAGNAVLRAKERILVYSGGLQPLEDELEAEHLARLATNCILIALEALHLYLPNVPIDPLASQRTREELVQDQIERREEQLRIGCYLEDLLTGNTASPILRLLSDRLSESVAAQHHVTSRNPVARNPDLALLTRFFGDVLSFTRQMLDSGKLSNLSNQLKSLCDDQSLARERSLQASLQSFQKRLVVEYATLDDLSTPLIAITSLLQIGFRSLLASSQQLRAPPTKQRTEKIVGALVKFPSTCSSAQFASMELPIKVRSVATLASSQAAGAVPTLLTVIAGLRHDIADGNSTTNVLRLLSRSYDQLFYIWTLDKEAERQAAEAQSSLFKTRDLDIDDKDDPEIQEAEFRSMFPDYSEDVMDSLSSNSTNDMASDRHPTYWTPEHLLRLHDLHLAIFLKSNDREKAAYQELRTDLIRSLLSSTYEHFTEKLDKESAAYQLFLLHREAGFGNADNKGANFYLDANIAETSKATVIVVAMKERLDELIKEWPDQMILQHIRDRCDAILRLDSASPVAKILASIEQLHSHTDDWEGYSNSSNTLEAHREKIRKQISEWRLLELHSWARLLDTQAEQHRNPVSEWWFRLFEVSVRGTQAAMAVSEDKGTEHLASLVGLLDQFIRSSDFGQYEARLELVTSFGSYLQMLSKHAPAAETQGLDKVARILQNISAFYCQFIGSIHELYAKQRAKIEKEIRDFIQLTRWKDINILSLRASAQKTHRKLHKCVRNFRAILRQPVDPILAGFSDNKIELVQDSSSENRAVTFAVPSVDPTLLQVNSTAEQPSNTSSHVRERPQHLQNLPRTFGVLVALTEKDLKKTLCSTHVDGVQDLTLAIIAQSRALAQATPALAKEDNLKVIKNLTNRKRKAWTDLLRELRRIGLSPFVSPDVVSRNQDPTFVYGRKLLMNGADYEGIRRIDSYFYRLLTTLPKMRDSLHSAQGDIPMSELQRGASYCEHAMSIVFQERERLVDLLASRSTLTALATRLLEISKASEVKRCPSGILPAIADVTWTMHRLVAAIAEFDIEAPKHSALSSLSSKGQDALRQELLSDSTLAKGLTECLTHLDHKLHCSQAAFWTLEEEQHIKGCIELLSRVANRLAEHKDSIPALAALSVPMHDWLQEETSRLSKRFNSLTESSESNAEEVTGSCDSVITSVLLIAQEIQKLPQSLSADKDSDDLSDHAITSDLRSLRAAERTLRIGEILDQIHASLRHDEAIRDLSRLAPFVALYTQLISLHVDASLRWLHSILKLTHIMSNTVTSLCIKGFCKPPEQDDSKEAESTGEGLELEGGTGLGDGTGAQDITDQMDEDETIEELQKNENEDENEGGDETQREKGAREAEDDFGGDLEEISANEDGQDDEEDEGSPKEEPDDHVGDVDPLDPNAVDEKIWSGEKKSEEQQDSSKDETSKDLDGPDGDDEASAPKQEGGKEDDKSRGESANDKQKKQDKEDGAMEQQPDGHSDTESVEGDEEPQQAQHSDEEIEAEEDAGQEQQGAGRKMDETVDQGDNLDIDDELNMSDDEGAADKSHEEDDLSDVNLDDDGDMDGADDAEQEEDRNLPFDAQEEFNKMETEPEDGEDAQTSEAEVPKNQGEDAMEEEDDASVREEADKQEGANAQDHADAMDGQDVDQAADDDMATDAQVSGDISASASQTQGARGRQGRQATSSRPDAPEGKSEAGEDASDETAAPNTAEDKANSSAAGSKAKEDANIPGDTPEEQNEDQDREANPIKSLGDALKQFRRNLDSIAEATPDRHANDETATEEKKSDGEGMPEEGEVEHIADDRDAEMQALGAADQEEATQRMDEGYIDDSTQASDIKPPDVDTNADSAMEEDIPALEQAPLPDFDQEEAYRQESSTQRKQQQSSKALLPSDIEQKDSRRTLGMDDADREAIPDGELLEGSLDGEHDEDVIDPLAEEDRSKADHDVEEELAAFRSLDADERAEKAAELWRSYTSMTSDLAFALCEQLRLILTPTLAARLNGDFRTGKRLNMRKIVPFIASDFAKDKIWLRRTKPSKREYQVLLALDDSRSMAENRSVHLAYQTLALVSGALGRLEVGDISICRFGENVQTLHPFGKGAFGDDSGGQILSQLSFEQRGTNMVRLVEHTLNTLQEARNTRGTSSGSSDLWQLEIIISDGVCQEHERLRSLLRRANEQRVMIVFVIVDSLAGGASGQDKKGQQASAANSILSMSSVRYETDPTSGRMELKMERYLDTFPFSYYVVLREAEALPEVLATTLRQWAEKIREAE